MMAILLPLGLAMILNLTLGGVTGANPEFPYAFADEDGGSAAESLRNNVLGEMEADGLVTVTDVDSSADVEALVDAGTVSAGIIVPAGFSTEVQLGGSPELQVIGDVDQRLHTDVARALAQRYAASLDALRISVATVLRDGEPATGTQATALAERAASLPDPIRVEDITASRRELDVTTYFAAGLAVFFLFFTVQFGISSILDERKEGTLARLLAAPIPPASVIGGKLLASFVMGVASMAVLVVSTTLLLDAQWGNPLGVAVLILAGVLAAVGIMAVVASLAKTSEQAGNWQSMIALVLGMLGGSFFSVAQAGGLLASLSLLTPHAWFLRGLGDLAGGAGAGAVLPAAGAILLFAAITLGVALLRLQRMVQP
jgi:ABC-2 type transport system permease protein